MITINEAKAAIDNILIKFRRAETRCNKINELGEKMQNEVGGYYISCTYDDWSFNPVIVNKNTGFCTHYRSIYI